MALWLPHIDAPEFVYAATVYGLAALALAHVCAQIGRKATLYFSKPAKHPPLFDALEALGANIVLTDVPLPLAEVEKQAEAYAQSVGAFYIPPGCNHPDFIMHMASVLEAIDLKPQEVWTCAVTGTFARAAQMAWPEAIHKTVCVVKTPENIGSAAPYFAAQKYHQAAVAPPPYPAFPQCDAKVWEFVKRHATKGALVWNIGA